MFLFTLPSNKFQSKKTLAVFYVDQLVHRLVYLVPQETMAGF